MNGTSFDARPRKAIGPDRPVYLGDGDLDRVMAVVLALASEVASLHERIANAGAPPATQAVESYEPDPATLAARDAWRDAYIKRLFRIFVEDVEALRRQPPAA